MIKSLYETHLKVRNLEEAITFYEKLDIKLAHKIDERRVAFFFIGKDKQMLGLWETSDEEEFRTGHFAFGVSLEDLERSMNWLKEKGIEPSENFFGKKPIEPVVHTWMPAASVYFRDPDGNSLEFITLLEGKGIQTNEVLYLSEWNEKFKK